MKQFLDKEQIQFYQEKGYLIVERFLTEESIKLLKKETRQIIADFDLQELKIFTTEDQNKHTDTYFLESGDKIRCFFEEGAINEAGELIVPKELAINKVGHAMHDLLPGFEEITYTQDLLSMTKSLGINQPAVVQSQYIFKQPNIGAKVNPHTDSTFIYTEPLSCLGVWVALEDATVENGCLTAVAGSHKIPLKERFIRNQANTGTEFVPLDKDDIDWDLQKMEPLPVKKGDMILLHGQLIHASFANRSEKSRHAFVLHIVDMDCNWSKDNWLQRPENFPFRSLESVVNQRLS